ncbi:MAG TPA: AI-2E family transporter [Nocardioidaceae bacterium]|nr:AI-2E family transporter [Nocardioidaceae bacterium]
MNPAEGDVHRVRDEVEEAATTAEEARRAAQEAEEAAERARDEAEGARGAAEQSAAQAARHELSVEEESEDFLRDRLPEVDSENAFGEPGRPLTRHSPFFMGFMGAVGALLAIWLGQQILSISSVLVLILVAMFLAVGLNPSVEFFLRHGLKRSWAVLLVTVGVVLALALFILAIVPVITDQVTTLTNRAPDWFNQFQKNRTIQDLDQRYGLIDKAQQTLADGKWANKVFGGVLGVGLAVLSAIANTFIVIVLTLYFLASLPGIKRFAYRFAPASRRERVTFLGDQILANVGGYVSGAFLVALAAGISSLVFLMIIGLGEYAVALAVVVMILDVIPMIGATLGAIIVTAIGFATDPKIGLACLIFYVLYQQFENYVIYPRVMARSVDIPGSLIVIAALVGAALLGVIGALLAIPTAAAVQLILKEVLLRRQDAR